MKKSETTQKKSNLIICNCQPWKMRIVFEKFEIIIIIIIMNS